MKLYDQQTDTSNMVNITDSSSYCSSNGNNRHFAGWGCSCWAPSWRRSSHLRMIHKQGWSIYMGTRCDSSYNSTHSVLLVPKAITYSVFYANCIDKSQLKTNDNKEGLGGLGLIITVCNNCLNMNVLFTIRKTYLTSFTLLLYNASNKIWFLCPLVCAV